MRSSKRRRQRAEHTESEENWLISYADLMTLLWGFFVIISAFSVPSKDLIEKLKQETAESMGGEYVQPFNELTDELKDVLDQLNLTENAKIVVLSDGVKLTIKSQYFFSSGSASLSRESERILSEIGKVLKRQNGNFKILVEGHTDDEPIQTKNIPSNWDLSSARASEVVRLFESVGVEHDFLRPIGLADVDPLKTVKGLVGRELAAARAENRRIVIRLQEILPSHIKGVKE